MKVQQIAKGKEMSKCKMLPPGLSPLLWPALGRGGQKEALPICFQILEKTSCFRVMVHYLCTALTFETR